MCDCDLDRPVVWEETWRVARKEHKCSECREPIKKHESYRFMKGLWEGRWESFKVCKECDRLINHLNNSHEDGFCYDLGRLFGCLIDCDVLDRDEETDLWVSNNLAIEVLRQKPLKCILKYENQESA